MRAMVLHRSRTPLQLENIPIPHPGPNQVLIHIQVCGVCRTDLHIIDGELTPPHLPLILGHQIVGIVEELGTGKKRFQVGDRVGVPWLGSSCQQCSYCLNGYENLCDNGIYTGYTMNGGFAEYCVAQADFIYPLPASYPSLHIAPLLCGGLIGYRAYRMAQDAKKIGFYGFGSAAHILAQIALYENRQIFAFTRQDGDAAQTLSKELGVYWTGSSIETPPEELDAAIIFASVGALVPLALKAVRKGGSVICAGTHMSDIPSFSYDILYGERVLRSVTNLTRQDGKEFLAMAEKTYLHTKARPYPLEKANEALDDLRAGRFAGSAVIVID
jgi:propanol-preferring alcohol dehydrogenase